MTTFVLRNNRDNCVETATNAGALPLLFLSLFADTANVKENVNMVFI